MTHVRRYVGTNYAGSKRGRGRTGRWEGRYNDNERRVGALGDLILSLGHRDSKKKVVAALRLGKCYALLRRLFGMLALLAGAAPALALPTRVWPRAFATMSEISGKFDELEIMKRQLAEAVDEVTGGLEPSPSPSPSDRRRLAAQAAREAHVLARTRRES